MRSNNREPCAGSSSLICVQAASLELHYDEERQ